MKLHVKLYLKNAFFLALLILTSSLWGQGGTFPVQVIPQVTPPPPIYLSNYADASTLNSPLRVQIILNDLNIQNREVRLKTYFQGSGLSFQSNDFVTGSTSLFLEGGVPLVLTNVELAPYFKFENITGISPNVYGNAIPEGTYQICFEVYDLATGNRLSSKSCATTVVFQNEPPFLISPRNKTNVAETNPQNIVFQWTPRSINVTNVEYELSLVEIWDTQIDPQAAFLSSPPIFQTTTSATTYVFGPSDPLLLSGKNYAWRIQAKAKQGTEEIGLFKNQGYSEIFSFSHASACDLPLGINHEIKGSTNANIFWDDFSTEVPEYTVRYRKKSSSNSSQAGGSEWFFNKTTSNTTSLWDLKAGTTYEYQLQKKCAVTKSEWSIAKQFTTHIADNEESVYECGITPDFSLNNTDPIDALEKGDKFTAGDFPIHVLEVSGSKGRFTGKGYVTIPYLNSIRVGVQFTNVLINTDKQLAEGTVITLYDPSLKNILDVDDAIETVGNVAEAVGELFEGDNDLDEIHVNWDIDPDKDIKIEDGILIITNPANGATETSPLGDDKVIVDKSGQTYHIDAGGKITKGEKIDPSGGVTNGNVTGVSNKGEIESLTAKGIQVTFESNGIYGYDIMPNIDNDKLNKEYTTIPDAEGGKYTLPHIAIEKEQTIVVTAKVQLSSNSEYKLEDLKFKTKVGELIAISAINEDNNSIELEISGHYTLENETIYAVVPDTQDSTKQLTAGAFTLWHLTDRVVNIVLVSIDKAPLPDTAEIARIFKKGGSTFNFETTTASLIGTNLLGDDDRLQIADNAWLNAYNEEQNSVITHIKSQIENFDKNKYYVLIFNNDFKTSRSIAGFMPLQRQFGFVFNGDLSTGEESKGDLTAVTAHELGHGIFALQHPFTEYGTEEKATDWLMDYMDGAVSLNHMNWAQMHNPALKFYVFQDEEDGQHYVVKKLFKNLDFGKNEDDTFTFLTPAGQHIVLPKNVSNVTNFYGYYGTSLTKDSDKFKEFLNVVPGTLKSFSIDSIVYTAQIEKSNNKYILKGYRSNKNTSEYYSAENYNISTSIANSEKAILFAFGVFQDKIEYLIQWTYTSGFDPFANNTILKSPIDFPFQFDNVFSRKQLEIKVNDNQFSFSSSAADWVFNTGKYIEDDKTLLLRNKLLELKTAYPEYTNQITTNYGAWNEENICLTNAYSGSFERALKSKFCISNEVKNQNTGGSFAQYVFDSTVTGFPNSIKEWQYLFYDHLLNSIEYDQAVLNNDLALFNTQEGINSTTCKQISTTINGASQNDIKTLPTNSILELIIKLLKEECTTEGDGYATGYENAIVKLIKYNAEGKELLDGLIAEKYYIDTTPLMEKLFETLDDWGGEANFTKFINALTTQWKNTSYFDPENYIALPYSSDYMLGFYYDNMNFGFTNKFKNISITETNASGYNTGPVYVNTSTTQQIGNYNIYQTIVLSKYNDINAAYQLPSAIIPIFILKALTVKNRTANWESAGALTFDVVTIASGVGSITKLSKLLYLQRLKNLNQLARIRLVFASTEFVAGSANLMLNLSDCNNEDNAQFCSELRTYLTFIELGAMAGGGTLNLAMKQALKRSADDAILAITKSSKKLPDDVLEELYAASKILDNNAVGNLVKFEKLTTLTNVDKVNALKTAIKGLSGADQGVLLQKIINLESDALRFLETFAENSDALVKLNANGMIASWKVLNANNKASYIATDINRLQQYNKLNLENQQILSVLTDKGPTTTLAKLLDEVKDNPKMAHDLNADVRLAKGMAVYNPKVAETLTDDDLSYIGDLLNSMDEISDNIRFWLTRSDVIAILRKYADEGIAFGKEVAEQLTGPLAKNSDAYNKLKMRLAGMKPSLNMDDYSIYSGVQLCLTKNCIDKGEYWIPDFVLVAKKQDIITKKVTYETIIVDAKRTRYTDFTPNQIEADNMTSWKIKAVEGKLIHGTDLNLIKNNKITKKTQFIKLFNEGGTLKTALKTN
ncbi:fibronectin type III domain-containing protein [Cellulophaga sp. L1A9]|uniref:fibronectin type III domain-containing protein n=1 Tax=Cellulophaga sp. L1A9 TaxID=2686362 RepID=UPI00131AEAD4|nr:fibronectin type III domain-containing protein [Cellulophaga sp. L1A9]